MNFPALENLIDALCMLPGVGRRSALRMAFHILRMDPAQARELSSAIARVQDEIHFCSRCGSLTDVELCSVCTDTRRDVRLLCVVEEAQDVYAIERTGEFRGRYHVLGGALSPLDGVGPEDLRLRELTGRLTEEPVEEVFLATNPTLEGDATAQYVATLLRPRQVRLTRISHGIPTGTPLEYADEGALARSIRARRSMDE